jgi:DNA-binding transcriptional regulator YbjK
MTVHSSEARAGRASADPDRAAKRERILDAAERVFAQRGFYAAKVADIAARPASPTARSTSTSRTRTIC